MIRTTRGPYSMDYAFSAMGNVKEAREYGSKAIKALSNYEESKRAGRRDRSVRYYNGYLNREQH